MILKPIGCLIKEVIVTINPQNAKMKQSRIVMEARDALGLLYLRVKERSTGPPDYERFYPIDLDLLVHSLGWTISRKKDLPVGQTADGEPIYGLCDFDNTLIEISDLSSLPPGQKRFSLAHEIGHIRLHEKIYPMLLRSPPIRGPKKRDYSHVEDEAERFAAELLMPPKAVKIIFERLFDKEKIFINTDLCDIDEKAFQLYKSKKIYTFDIIKRIAVIEKDKPELSLVNFFGVSQIAMARRLRALNLIRY